MRDITLMPNDYIVTHIKTDTICEHFSNDDVVYAVDERIVPLVRCKECKHRYTIDCFRAYLEYDIQEWVVDSGDDDDFCSYGEREGE